MAIRNRIRGLAFALTCVLSAFPAYALQQLTDSNDSSCTSSFPFALSTGGAAFESDCDLTGGNPDGNREVFRVDGNGSVTQVTDTQGCVNGGGVSSAAGDILAFESDCDFGGNADGNVEIVVVAEQGLVEITESSSCSNAAPSLAGDGSMLAFDSDCDLVAGTNAERSVEVFRSALDGAIQQWTDDRSASGCGSQRPALNYDGSAVAFESDCDLVGTNEDQVNEIFKIVGSVVSQVTQAPADNCLSTGASIDDIGTVIVFQSNCDFDGKNSDESVEIFAASSAGIAQVSTDGGDPGCESMDPRVTSDGLAVIYSSYCDPVGLNGDGSFEVFWAQRDSVVQITQGEGCSSVLPTPTSATLPLVWVSDCDPLQANADGGTELFTGAGCVCGAPRTKGSAPTAADALFALQAAVNSRSCAACECDVNSDRRITASDAFAILKNAVGQDIDLVCS